MILKSILLKSINYLLPEFAPGVVGAPDGHVDTIEKVRLITNIELQKSMDKKICRNYLFTIFKIDCFYSLPMCVN